MQLLTGKDAKTHEFPGNGYVQVLLRPSGKSWGKIDFTNSRRGIYPPRATNLSLAEQVMFAQQLEPHFVGSETVHFLDARSILTHIDIL